MSDPNNTDYVIKRVKIAFRKLKAYVYFDKTALPLRDRVVEYESRFKSSIDFTKYSNKNLIYRWSEGR